MLEVSPFEYTGGMMALLAVDKSVQALNMRSGRLQLQVVNLKFPVRRIVWVGPYQILMVDENEKLYYLELFCD